MATERNIRVSDADRDRVAAQLREHYAQGRLTQDELNERLDRTFASRTNLELAAVTSDLPYAPPRGVLPSDRLGRGGSGWAGRGWAGPDGGDDSSWDARREHPASALRFLPLLLAFCCLLIALSALGFGLGSGPSLLVIILGALAVLRRLFGRRRRWGRPPMRPRGRRF